MADRRLVRGLGGEPRAILVEGSTIAALDDDAESAVGADTLEARGATAHPGFIDLQVNGCGDADFTSDPDSMWRVGPALARHGVTSFLATIVTGPPGTVDAAVDALRDPPQGWTAGAVPIGIHAEGPFLSPERRGAHDASLFRDPDLDELIRWVSRGVRLVTLAPERTRALDAIVTIVAHGAVAAIGHTDANAEAAQRGIEAGARYATHLFNAMPPMTHRSPGAAGALLADPRVTIGLIADGHHVDPRVLAIAARAASGRLSLVSDAVGPHVGAHAVTHAGGAAQLADGTRAGGSAGVDVGVRLMAPLVGRDAAIEAVTATPSRLLGLDDGRGGLRVGGMADVTLLDDDLNVVATLAAGAVAYRA
jgi:N-acetylglucosamine-6-phosphate deacetylase